MGGKIGIRVHEKSITKFKNKIRKITSRNNAWDMNYRMLKLKQCIIGWVNYFGIADMTNITKRLDEWTRRRLRMCYWKQWKKIKTKHDNLARLGLNEDNVWRYANTRKGYWRIAGSQVLGVTLTNKYFENIGYTSICNRYRQVH